MLDMELEPSELFLTGDECDDEPRTPLYLPRRDTAPCALDEYLRSIPRVVSRADELMGQTTSISQTVDDDSSALHPLHAALSSRCLNVLQGEVAHASALQADVIFSSEATTCHVVAIRSTASGQASIPLVSLAHVDQSRVYDNCFDAMLQEHWQHHQPASSAAPFDNDEYGFFMDDDEAAIGLDDDDEDDAGEISGTEDDPHFLPSFIGGLDRRTPSMPMLTAVAEVADPIEMELHMLGGYLDANGTSQELSTSLVTTFSKLADKYKGKLRISLSTAAISSMNTSTSNHNDPDGSAPKSRGLGIDTRTGKVFIVDSLPGHLQGPAVDVRSARAWAATTAGSHPKLAIIHDTKSIKGQVRVEPFLYQAQENLNALLQVTDAVLLQLASTSPAHESDQFCSNIRRTVSFLNTTSAAQVFGKDCVQPLVFQRTAEQGPQQNEWEAVVL